MQPDENLDDLIEDSETSFAEDPLVLVSRERDELKGFNDFMKKRDRKGDY